MGSENVAATGSVAASPIIDPIVEMPPVVIKGWRAQHLSPQNRSPQSSFYIEISPDEFWKRFNFRYVRDLLEYALGLDSRVLDERVDRRELNEAFQIALGMAGERIDNCYVNTGFDKKGEAIWDFTDKRCGLTVAAEQLAQWATIESGGRYYAYLPVWEENSGFNFMRGQNYSPLACSPRRLNVSSPQDYGKELLGILEQNLRDVVEGQKPGCFDVRQVSKDEAVSSSQVVDNPRKKTSSPINPPPSNPITLSPPKPGNYQGPVSTTQYTSYGSYSIWDNLEGENRPLQTGREVRAIGGATNLLDDVFTAVEWLNEIETKLANAEGFFQRHTLEREKDELLYQYADAFKMVVTAYYLNQGIIPENIGGNLVPLNPAYVESIFWLTDSKRIAPYIVDAVKYYKEAEERGMI